jgi:hypothetical protein
MLCKKVARGIECISLKQEDQEEENEVENKEGRIRRTSIRKKSCSIILTILFQNLCLFVSGEGPCR